MRLLRRRPIRSRRHILHKNRRRRGFKNLRILALFFTLLILRTHRTLGNTLRSTSQETLTRLRPPPTPNRARRRRKLIIRRANDTDTVQQQQLFLGRRTRFIPSSLIQIRKRIAKPVAQISGASVLFCKDGVFDDGGPCRAVFLVSCFESTVFGVGEWTPTFASCLFEERGAVSKGGADFAGEMRACVWVVPLVGVGEIGAEPARDC